MVLFGDHRWCIKTFVCCASLNIVWNIRGDAVEEWISYGSLKVNIFYRIMQIKMPWLSALTGPSFIWVLPKKENKILKSLDILSTNVCKYSVTNFNFKWNAVIPVFPICGQMFKWIQQIQMVTFTIYVLICAQSSVSLCFGLILFFPILSQRATWVSFMRTITVARNGSVEEASDFIFSQHERRQQLFLEATPKWKQDCSLDI